MFKKKKSRFIKHFCQELACSSYDYNFPNLSINVSGPFHIQLLQEPWKKKKKGKKEIGDSCKELELHLINRSLEYRSKWLFQS